MARRLPSLRPPAQDAGLQAPRAGLRSFNRRWVVTLTWIVLWMPISALFSELNAHLPVPPFFMPIFFVFIPLLGGSLDHPGEIWLPTAVFWGGLLLVLRLRRRFPGPEQSS
jgi:hypothetical protein